MSLSNEFIIESIRGMRVVTYFDVAASTVFIWDYILTLPLELDLVWRTKWNAMKCLYLVQRYLPFFDTVVLVLYHQTTRMLSDIECRHLYYASGCLIIIGMACSEIILTLRVWAVWNRGARLGVVLCVLYAMVWFPDFAYLAFFLRSLRIENPPIQGFIGCLITHVDHILVMCWTVILIWDAIVLGLMAVPGFRAYSIGGNSELLKVVFRDGALYYLILFLLSTINIIVITKLPAQYAQLLTTMARCFHSMLTSRVLLHIRSHTSAVPPVFRDDADENISLTHLQNGLMSTTHLPTTGKVPRLTTSDST